MRMADVRVGMRLRSVHPPHDEVTVTSVERDGFTYSLDADKPFVPRWDWTIAKDGHRHFGLNGEAQFEPAEAPR